jgi:hypothetical protein
MSYEEVFIPEPIKGANLRVLLVPEDMKNAHTPQEHGTAVKNHPSNVDSAVIFPGEDVVCTHGGLEGKVFIKNYLRLILQCDSINRLLYLDLFEKRQKLYGVYDRYGRVRKGVSAKLSKDYKVYRLYDVKNGKTCIVKLQDIKCNKADEPLAYLYSLWDTSDSPEPFYVGVTY